MATGGFTLGTGHSAAGQATHRLERQIQRAATDSCRPFGAVGAFVVDGCFVLVADIQHRNPVEPKLTSTPGRKAQPGNTVTNSR